MNVLYLTRIAPYPVTGGQDLRADGLIRALSDVGHVNAVVHPDSTDFPDIENVTFQKASWRTPKGSDRDFYRQFLKERFRTNEKVRELIKKTDSEFDVAFIDSDGYLGQYIQYFKERSIPVIYGTHNVQSRLTWQQPRNSLVGRSKKVIRFVLERLHERLYFGGSDALICVSDVDRVYYEKYLPSERVYTIPNFVDLDRYQPTAHADDGIVMSGNFEAFQNRAAIEWFLERVWEPYDLSSHTRLLLVGNGSETILDEFDEADGVNATGAVPDVSEHISSAKLAIVPLRHGSGTRLKILEAMALYTPVLSTTVGAEGINHRGTVEIADTPAEFARSLISLLADESMAAERAERAYEVVQSEYSLDAIRPRLRAVVEQVIGQSNPVRTCHNR